MNVAIIAITANGARIGAALQSALPESRLFAIDRHAEGAAEPFSCGVKMLVRRLWPHYRGLVFIMATGIVVRAVAPLVQAKERDPAVVVLDDAGTFAISLLSGHLGGANELAGRCAEAVGATPVITTATDVNHLPSFDMLAQNYEWIIDDISRVKALNALVLEGKEIAVVDHAGAVRDYCAGKAFLTFYDDIPKALAAEADGRLLVTNRILPADQDSDRTLVLRPRDLCLGIGCNRGTSAREIESVVLKNLARLGLSLKSVKCVATAQAKEDEDGLLEFARRFAIRRRFFDNDALNGAEVPSPPSAHAVAAIGAKGVAEPAALLASEGGKLLLNKVKDGNVTLAIAETPATFPAPKEG